MPSKVLLCIPPDYEHNYPPLATPVLVSFLKSRCIAAEQLDLNIRYRNFLLRRLEGPLDVRQKKFLLENLIKKFFSERLKNRTTSDFLIPDTKALPFLPYDNNTNSSFHFCERLLSSNFLWRYLEDEDENTFLQFFKEERFLAFLKKHSFNLLGLSVISPSQALASLTLGLWVKKNLPGIHVTLGGQWPTLFRRALMDRQDLFKCFDSVVVFDGETPLGRLAEAFEKKEKQVIPNVIFKGDTRDWSRDHSEEDLNLLPCPDFDGLPLEEYDAVEETGVINLTYETSRGCYWSQCAYCVDLPLPRPSYRARRPELVARDMKRLTVKYGAKYFMMGDPGMSPRQMSGIAEKILENKIKADWWCMARLDPGFNEKVFALAHSSGLKKINFGFESANDKICGFMHKGNTAARSRAVIRDCARSGIAVDLQTMLGLPGETFSDGLETVNFLIENKKWITDVTFNVYYLTPENLVYTHPEKYGISYDRSGVLPFRFFTPFKNLGGMSQQDAFLLQKIYHGLLAQKAMKKTTAGKIRRGRRLLGWAPQARLCSLKFGLNGESVTQDIFINAKTGAYVLLGERERAIFYSFKDGLSFDEAEKVFRRANAGAQEPDDLLCFLREAKTQGLLVEV